MVVYEVEVKNKNKIWTWVTEKQMEKEGFELISCSTMPSSKGILVFKKIGTEESTE